MSEQLIFELAASGGALVRQLRRRRQRRGRRGAARRRRGAGRRHRAACSGARRLGQDAPACARSSVPRGRSAWTPRSSTRRDRSRQRTRSSPVAGHWSRSTMCDAAEADAQARLFTLFNVLRPGGGHLLVASEPPPAQLPLREDLRTRLGWGTRLRSSPADRRREAGSAGRLRAAARFRPRRRRHRLSARPRPAGHGDSARHAGSAGPPVARDASGRSRCRCCGNGCSAAPDPDAGSPDRARPATLPATADRGIAATRPGPDTPDGRNSCARSMIGLVPGANL